MSAKILAAFNELGAFKEAARIEAAQTIITHLLLAQSQQGPYQSSRDSLLRSYDQCYLDCYLVVIACKQLIYAKTLPHDNRHIITATSHTHLPP